MIDKVQHNASISGLYEDLQYNKSLTSIFVIDVTVYIVCNHMLHKIKPVYIASKSKY